MSLVVIPESEMLQSQPEPDAVQLVIVPPSLSNNPPRAIVSSSQVTVTPPVERQLIGTLTVSENDSVNESVYVMSEWVHIHPRRELIA